MDQQELPTNGIYDLKSLKDAISAGKRFQFAFFWEVSKPNGVCSQWSHHSFTIDGHTYSCAEQYMMAEKARVFNDTDALDQILKTKDPRTMKKLGRLVRNFNPEQWNSVKSDIVFNGNLHKFSQNKQLHDFILSLPKETVFVEASPHDNIWGIGLRANGADAQDPFKWKGVNLLGFAITKARDHLLRNNV